MTMSLEEFMQQSQQQIMLDLNTAVTNVHSGLVENFEVNVIPESLFVNYFLPNILGTVHNPNWVVEWISIAGRPASPLGVVADGTNDLLFTVPGIMSTSGILINTEGFGGLADVFKRYEQIKSNIPAAGTRYLNEQLYGKTQAGLENYDNTADINAWRAILARYGMMPAGQQQQAVSQTLDDYFE